MAQLHQETVFEKRRGISRVEVRRGYAQVHVSQLADIAERLNVLEEVANAEVSIDFLKLTPTGLSFIVPEASADALQPVLERSGFKHAFRRDRSIVLVHAVNIRDEEGIVARIIRATFATGAHVDHIGDMHDRMLLVVRNEDVPQVVSRYREMGGEDLEVVGL
jgi:aspartokinase